MKALSDVAATANTDTRKAFGQYSKDVSKLESTATRIRSGGQSMKEQGQAYFKQWEQQLAQLIIRRLAPWRNSGKPYLQEAFESIRKYTEPLKTQFDPWMSDLKDLQKYLSSDLTIAGVDAAKSLFAKTTAEGLEVQKSMDRSIAELNTIVATITPAKVEKK